MGERHQNAEKRGHHIWHIASTQKDFVPAAQQAIELLRPRPSKQSGGMELKTYQSFIVKQDSEIRNYASKNVDPHSGVQREDIARALKELVQILHLDLRTFVLGKKCWQGCR